MTLLLSNRTPKNFRRQRRRKFFLRTKANTWLTLIVVNKGHSAKINSKQYICGKICVNNNTVSIHDSLFIHSTLALKAPKKIFFHVTEKRRMGGGLDPGGGGGLLLKFFFVLMRPCALHRHVLVQGLCPGCPQWYPGDTERAQHWRCIRGGISGTAACWPLQRPLQCASHALHTAASGVGLGTSRA